MARQRKAHPDARRWAESSPSSIRSIGKSVDSNPCLPLGTWAETIAEPADIADVALRKDDGKDAAIYSVLTLKENFQQSTMNLLAPIVLNTKEKLGKQIVLQDSEQYPLRYLVGMADGSVK